MNFESGDLGASLHGTTVSFSSEQVDGVWNVSGTVTDVYDYEFTTNYDNPALITANNAAVFSQDTGVLSNFDVTIDVNTTVDKE